METVITAHSLFSVKADFRAVLDLVPGVDKNKSVFTYDEVSSRGTCTLDSLRRRVSFSSLATSPPTSC